MKWIRSERVRGVEDTAASTNRDATAMELSLRCPIMYSRIKVRAIGKNNHVLKERRICKSIGF